MYLQLDLTKLSLIAGPPREGEGRLEETLSSGEESPLPRFILSNFRRNEIPNWRVEDASWWSFDC